MDIQEHHINDIKIAEIISDDIIIQNLEEALDVMGNMYYQGFEGMIIREQHITPDFFDLKNKMAGDILQKFATYRMRLAIVGDYSKFTSKSLGDFIYESNKGRHIYFVASTDDAINKLAH